MSNATIPRILHAGWIAPLLGWLVVGTVWSGELLEGEYPITAEDREHWSFQPLVRPELPQREGEDRDDGERSNWEERNAIDRFVNAELRRRGLRPLPAADRRALIRRVTFDLTGLPPTPDEVRRFVNDTSAGAYERLVDRLLASPAFGEHVAQFWLDLARFAETDGFEHDKVRPEAWRYRDWVIEAFNRDLPYDRFVQWQLAGDELRDDDPAARIATSFCLAGPDMPDINSQELRRHQLLNEMTSTVGAALLGLQLGCAQCHDHKYDPLSQGDFYRLRAVFEPAVQVERNKSVSTLSETGEVEPSFVRIRGEWDRRGAAVEPAFPRIANPQGATLATHFGDKPASGASSGRRLALARWITRPDNPLAGRVIANRLWQMHFGQGLSRTPNDFGLMGDPPSHPQLLDWLACELARRDFHLKEIHRLIVMSATYRRASQPVADASGTAADARTTIADVAGTNADAPGKPLDRPASVWREAVDRDPHNYYLARYPRRRLRGEMLRDAMFAVSGSLQRRMGGPGVMPPLPPELLATLLRNQWKTSPREADHYRRSVYVFARRNLTYPLFDAFDRPAANASCPRRDRSTTAPQALLLLNSQTSLDAARRLAGRVLETRGPSPEAWIKEVFLRTLGRAPAMIELAESRAFLERQRELLQQSAGDDWKDALPIPAPKDGEPRAAVALTDLCLALLNCNEFLYLD